ncbi:unnamed protein product [Lactuca virosa]|uniref:Retrotransposon gag domain-containing protein n=1 Tax=Lactuca virosa TaxID=75947 RepID=A0AAU9P237_9ASTR|nr:unnamed protein product [Lactuca virosa]
MPLFEGEDACGWVYKAEQLFDMQGLGTSSEKLRAAVLCIEGPVLSWYRWNEQQSPFQSWEELKHRLLDRFQPSQYGNLYQQFLAISQDSRGYCTGVCGII